MSDLIDVADLRRIVLIHHGTGTVDVRTMTRAQAIATGTELADAHRDEPGPVTVRLVDVTEDDDLTVHVTGEAADRLVADARARKAHPAL